MSETVIFQCDFCGARSEEEPTTWPRPKRARVELVLPADRLHVGPRAAGVGPYEGSPGMFSIPGFPFPLPVPPPFPGPVGAAFPPAAMPPLPAAFPELDPGGTDAATGTRTEECEEPGTTRWVASLCDACARRIGGLLDLRVETTAEAAAREAMREAAERAERTERKDWPAGIAASRGKLVDHFPSPPPSSKPGTGGLVDQYPTPPSGDTGASAAPAPAASAPAAQTAKEDGGFSDLGAGGDPPAPK